MRYSDKCSNPANQTWIIKAAPHEEIRKSSTTFGDGVLHSNIIKHRPSTELTNSAFVNKSKRQNLILSMTSFTTCHYHHKYCYPIRYSKPLHHKLTRILIPSPIKLVTASWGILTGYIWAEQQASRMTKETVPQAQVSAPSSLKIEASHWISRCFPGAPTESSALVRLPTLVPRSQPDLLPIFTTVYVLPYAWYLMYITICVLS